MQLRWSVDDELESLELGSDATLQVMRVLQEAVANAVKHSGAQHVTVQAWREAGADPRAPDALVLEILDDGGGLAPVPAAGSGRGLAPHGPARREAGAHS